MDDDALDRVAQQLVSQVRAIPDRAARVTRTNTLIDGLKHIGDELSRIRREDLADWAKDTQQKDIAGALGMTPQRVSQLLNKGPKPSRLILGGPGDIRIVIGGKLEAGKDNPGDVISAEATAAYKALDALARSYGARTELEIVPQPGWFDLNCDNLVALTSPRLLRSVGLVLPTDPHLRFRDNEGWYLVDLTTDTAYRPPTGPDASIDYAYLGCLPRPDQRGNFLYLAGVHALGTLGATLFLADHIDEIYRVVKDSRWSTIVEVRFDPGTRQITATRRVTPIYKHQAAAA